MMAPNLDTLAGEGLRNGESGTGERGAGAGIAAHGVWDHAARFVRNCALSPYRRTAVECLWLLPGDTVVDLGCSSAVELGHLQRAVGPRGKVLAVESAERRLERVGRWISLRGWANVHPVRAEFADYRFPAEVAGILCAGAVVRVGDWDDLARRAAGALRTGGRLVLLDSSVLVPTWSASRGRSPGADASRGGPKPLDLYIWKAMSRHMAPALFQQRLFGVVFMVAGESR